MSVRGRDRIWAAGAAVVVLVATFAYAHTAHPHFTGDEPHYTIYARSIGEGWGLDLERAHRDENTLPIYGGPIGIHGDRYAGEDGRLASWHSVGLPLLLAAPVAVHPSPWTARHVMLLLGAALAHHLVLLCRRAAGCRPELAAAATTGVLLAPPLVYYAGLVFPEVPAALLVVLFLRAALARRYVGASIAAGLLPWFGLRYGILAAGLLGLLWLVELRRRRPADLREALRVTAPLAVPAGILGVALVLFNLELYGAVSTPQDTAGTAYYRPKNVYLYGLGGVLGFPSGILPLAPLLLAPLAALFVAVRRVGLAVVGVVGVAVAYVAFNGYFGSPGFCPPGRYVVTVVPLLAVPLAIAVLHGRWLARGAVGMLAALTALSTWTSVSDFNRLFTADREGVEPIAATADLWPYVLEDARPSGWASSAPGLQHVTGALDGDERLVAREGRDPAGMLVFGPYVELQPGRYAVAYAMENPSGEDARLNLDVHGVAGGVLASRPAVVAAGAAVTEVLEFETDGEEQVELRAWWEGDGTIAVSGVRADLVESLPTRRTRGEVWKTAAWLLAACAVAGAWWRADRSRPPGDGGPVAEPSPEAAVVAVRVGATAAPGEASDPAGDPSARLEPR